MDGLCERAPGHRHATPAGGIRWLGLALFGLTTAKVFVIDFAALSGIYRVVSSLALGVGCSSSRSSISGGSPRPRARRCCDRPRIAAAAVASVAAGTVLVAQLPDAWRPWRYAAPVEVEPAAEPRLVSILVPDTLTAQAGPGWSDVRVIDGDGREVPHLLDARGASERREWRQARLFDRGFVPGRYTQAILDLGVDAGIHNAVHLTFAGDADLQSWVEIAVSADSRTWQILEARADYRLRQASRGERTDVTYPDSRSRYVRVRILETDRPVDLESARVAYEIQTPVERNPAGVALSLTLDKARPTESIWTSADASSNQPIAEARFETAERQLARGVVVEVADERDRWRQVGSGEIRRVPDRPDRPLSIEFPETVGRRWRVTVRNGNDPPVSDLTPTFHMTSRWIVFRQEPGGAYRVIYGHSRAEAPRYELARVTSRAAIEAAAPARLGAAIANAAYVDTAPWSERHPVVLWGALAVAVLLLGWLAVRTLRLSTPVR